MIQGNYQLTAVVSHITDPFAVSDYTFAYSQWNDETQDFDFTPSPATLYVPVGTKEKYEELSGWTWFAGIEESQNENAIVRIGYKSESDTWHTLQGVKVNNPRKGVFIRNGQKVVIK